jgi:hypothetical protein
MEFRVEPLTPPTAPAPRTPDVLQTIPPPNPPVESSPIRLVPSPVAPVDPPSRNLTPLAPVDPPSRTPPADPLPPMVTPPPPTIDLRPAPQPQPPLAAATNRLKMLMRLGDGKPRFEIRHSDSVELLLKVYGERVEMQSPPEGANASPIAGVTAVGKVRFTGPMIEGTCDQLTVLSGTGEVLLKGNVHVKTKRGKTWSEMTTEKMIYQIGASGLTTSTGTNPIQPTVYEGMR